MTYTVRLLEKALFPQRWKRWEKLNRPKAVTESGSLLLNLVREGESRAESSSAGPRELFTPELPA